MEVRILSCHKDWGREALSFLIITFQRDASQVLEKDFPGCKTGKKLGEGLHLKKTQCIIASVLNGRKGRSWAYSQEETSLKFSQARGNVRALISDSLQCFSLFACSSVTSSMQGSLIIILLPSAHLTQHFYLGNLHHLMISVTVCDRSWTTLLILSLPQNHSVFSYILFKFIPSP